MNDQQIYVLLATRPGVRAVQIADSLDAELTDVSAALRSLVEVGDVVKTKGEAPNGQQAMFYELSDEFKRSKDGRAIMEAVKVVAAPAPEPAAAPAAPAPVEAAPTPAPAPAPAPIGTKVDRGVALILSRDGVTDDDLRAEMIIPKTSPPSAYLTAAIRDGRVHKDGRIWRAGRMARTPGTSIALSSTKNEPVAQFDPRAPLEYPDGAQLPAAAPAPVTREDVQDLPQELMEQLTQTVQAMAAEPAPAAEPIPAPEPAFTPRSEIDPKYRCGLWSDGVLELQRNGQTVVLMTRREHEFMADFLGRALARVDAGAP